MDKITFIGVLEIHLMIRKKLILVDHLKILKDIL